MIVLMITICLLFFQAALAGPVEDGVSSSSISVTPTPTDICSLPPVTGFCNAAFRRFFYNSTSRRCETFTWGGCGGNENNFETRENCENTCRSGPTVQPSPTDSEITDPFCAVNNCTNNYSNCYVYSATGEQYCAPSCKLSNGGCGMLQCVMVTVQCVRAPCPPIVECRQPRSSSSYSIAPTPTTPTCPVRGQFYTSGGCHPVDPTCDNLEPPILCDASLCVCPRGQVISRDGRRCINVTECGSRSVEPSPTGITDPLCAVNNCTNNYSNCYVYSATGEQYCAPSCKLNNGGCGTLQCVMVTAQCFRAPCPPIVECQRPRSTSFVITPTPQLCPIRGQVYNNGGCHPVGATCDDPEPPLLCGTSCACPRGQVISPDGSSCIGVADCPVCPARGQTYITETQCYPHNATCDNPSPNLLCDVSRCECLYGQVLNQEANECVDAASCVRCPIRGQYYSVGGCHGENPTCDNPNPPILCDASLCVCPDGQVVSPDGSRCMNTTECPNSVCDLPPLVGDCDAVIQSYFYNRTSRRCERFIWGGCGGNGNRFETVEGCIAECDPGATIRPSPTGTGITDLPCQVNICNDISFCYIFPETGEPYCAESCQLNNGRCGDQECIMVRQPCPGPGIPCPPLAQCQPKSASIETRTSVSPTSVSPTSTPSVDICRLQPESGLCLANFPSYFFNSSSRMCEMFTYGGCGGNENRFRTIDDCRAACGQSVNICELDPVAGPCEGHIPSVFYNATSQRCERFVFGGCRGNRNRFSSATECQKACVTTDICGLQAEPGNCRGSFPSYFFNSVSGECEMFIYGGCGGNRNRFSDIDSCRRTCSGSTTPTPVLPKRNVIVVTVSFTGDDLDTMVADFAAELTNVLINNGYEDAAIRVVDVSYDDKNDVVLSVAVYSREDIVDGAMIAALINDNLDNFDTSVSGAVVETSDDSGDSDGLSSGAIAGIVVGCVIAVAVVLLVVVVLLFIIRKQSGSTAKYAMKGSEGISNPVYSEHKK